MTFSQRILHLIELKQIKNPNEFGKILGYSSSEKISRLIRDESAKPSLDILIDITNKFGDVNTEWLLTGNGSPLKNETTQPRLSNHGVGVPYYDIDITGGIVESFNDVKEKPDFFVDFKPFNDCAAYMPIFGDSMYPMFASGEILAVKQMHNYDAILWGEPYLVVTNAEWDNLRTVKLVHPHDEQDKIILRASNPNFKGDTVVPKTAIVGLFIVKGKINRRQL